MIVSPPGSTQKTELAFAPACLAPSDFLDCDALGEDLRAGWWWVWGGEGPQTERWRVREGGSPPQET